MAMKDDIKCILDCKRNINFIIDVVQLMIYDTKQDQRIGNCMTFLYPWNKPSYLSHKIYLDRSVAYIYAF